MTPRFDHPLWALGAVGVALLAAAGVGIAAAARRRRLAALAPEPTLARLLPAGGVPRSAPRALRLGAAALLAGFALAGPRWGEATGARNARGLDVVLAVDASLSMLARDEAPSRLDRVKQEIRRYRAMAPDDRVALIAFAGRSYILTPLTSDDGAVALLLDNLDPTVVGQAGTSLAPALRQGVELLQAAPTEGDRALVVLSDGEAFDDPALALDAARRARAAGVHLVTIGFGTTAGATIPVVEGGAERTKRDLDGSVVITRAQPDLLRAVAEAAGGTYIDLAVRDKASRLHADLSRLRSAARRVDARLGIPLRYQWFLLPAVVCLLLDTLLNGARRPAAALALSLLVPAGAAAQDPRREAERLYAAGRPADAAARLREAIAGGDRSARTAYNYGTALLAADSLGPAIEALERAAAAADPVIRRRALFNLGLALLQRGRAAPPEEAERILRASARAYRALLLEQPDDTAAKFNYELALRRPPAARGGGGEGGTPPRPRPADAPAAPPRMSAGQAAQLLDAAARDEREVRARRQRGIRPDAPANGKDW